MRQDSSVSLMNAELLLKTSELNPGARSKTIIFLTHLLESFT